MNRKFAPLFIAPVLFLCACGGGSSSSGSSGGGGGTTPQAISVTFPAGVPPTSLNGGGQTPLEANIANDSANAGVTWSCAPAGSCGSFNPATTTNGNPTTYTAPVGASAPASVTVTATSVTDPTKSAHATIAINAIAVQLAQAPPASLPLSDTASVAATVLNDSANAGVTWSCAPAGSCGSFSSTTTLSSDTTTYTAPAAVPSGGSVTITATSITDTTKTVQASVSITSNITVTLSQPPPASLPASGTSPSNAQVTATVANDSANAGVNWSCTPANTCGSFSPTSGTATTYTAPSAGGTITIIASSVSDPSKIASASVVIIGTATVSTLKGQYSFLAQAPAGLRSNTTWVGSVTLDGTGKITTGVEDIVSPNYNDQDDIILSTSTYTVDPTGHGRLTIFTTNGETLGISFVATSASHAEIIETDPMGGDGGDPATGTLDLQTSAAFSVSSISGDYSFTMTGIDISSATTPKPYLAFGGEFSAAGSAGITSGAIDVTSTGAPIQNSGITSGSFDIPPDANGRGSFHIVVNSPGTSRTFVFYVVSSKVLRLMESDGIAAMGGSAYSQGAASTTLSGNYVYQHSGWTSSGRTVAAGQFSTSSTNTSLTGGVSDANAGKAAPTTATTATAVSGSYTVVTTENDTITFSLTDAAGTSTLNAYIVDPSINILDPNNSSGGGGALLLHTDSNINGVGILLPQAPTSPFAGHYALNLNNSIAAATPNELDLVGVLAADGKSSFGTTNLADYDENGATANPMIGAGLTGSFAADTTNLGRYTGSFTVTQPASSTTGTPYPFIPSSAFTVAIYPTGNSQGFIVETDTQSSIQGRLVQQKLP